MYRLADCEARVISFYGIRFCRCNIRELGFATHLPIASLSIYECLISVQKHMRVISVFYSLPPLELASLRWLEKLTS